MKLKTISFEFVIDKNNYSNVIEINRTLANDEISDVVNTVSQNMKLSIQKVMNGKHELDELVRKANKMYMEKRK